MRDSKSSVISLLPVLRLAILIGIRRDDLAPQHHGVDVEVIILTDRKKPNILRSVFPVCLRPAPLFTLPRDPVLRQKIFLPDAMNRRRAAPVAANIDGRRR